MNFLALLFLTICVAAVFPVARSGGPLHPDLTVFWGVVVGIFLIEGLTLPTAAIRAALPHAKVHVSLQAFNLVLMPLIAVGATALLELQPGVRDGVVAAMAVPTTTGMSVMLASVSGGNVGLAAFDAVLGNSLALLVTPFTLSLACTLGPVDYPALVLGMVGRFVLPLALGQLLAPRLAPALAAHKPLVVKANQALILALVFQIFSDVFYRAAAVPPAALAQVAALVCAAHALFLGGAWLLGGALRLPPADRVAFLLCASQKTVILGLPLLQQTFAGVTAEQWVMVVLPLTLYHVLELATHSALLTHRAPSLGGRCTAEDPLTE